MRLGGAHHRRGYVFESWSYDSRRLGEVRPGDRIYYPTTLYAIWTKQKAKNDEEVEAIDTRAVNEHKAYMFGYPDGRFRPNEPITRAEFTQMISVIDSKPYGEAPADVKGHWAERAIGSEYQAGRIKDYPGGRFRPNAYITRCEAVVILNKIFDRKYDEISPIHAINSERIKRFIDLTASFWGYNDMVEATNSHSFKRRVPGRVEEDWVEVK